MCIPRVWHFMKESSVICEYVRFFLASNVCVCTIMLYNAYYSHLIYFLFNRWNETQKGNNRRTSSRMYAYTMAHNNQITSWKIYLVKKMTHIRSEIIVHAYNFCLLLLVHRAVAWKDMCVCGFLFLLHENGVKWYMTGRMFWIYCDYYIFLSFGYCCCLFHCQANSSIVPKQQCNGNRKIFSKIKKTPEWRDWWLFSRCYFLILTFYIYILVCVSEWVSVHTWCEALYAWNGCMVPVASAHTNTNTCTIHKDKWH